MARIQRFAVGLLMEDQHQQSAIAKTLIRKNGHATKFLSFRRNAHPCSPTKTLKEIWGEAKELFTKI